MVREFLPQVFPVGSACCKPLWPPATPEHKPTSCPSLHCAMGPLHPQPISASLSPDHTATDSLSSSYQPSAAGWGLRRGPHRWVILNPLENNPVKNQPDANVLLVHLPQPPLSWDLLQPPHSRSAAQAHCQHMLGFLTPKTMWRVPCQSRSLAAVGWIQMREHG